MSNWSVLPTSANINTHLVSYSLLNILNIIDEAFQRIHPRPGLTTSEQTSPFLELPFEMRQAIYEAAILDDTEGGSDSEESATISTSINLLQTCRQVKMEAEPIRYQRPQSFSSQAKLFLWLDRSREANLERVHTLTLHLTDVDLSRLLDPTMTSAPKHPTAWSIYEEALGRLEDALRSLPNLSSLTIIPPKDNRSALLKKFSQLFLTTIPTHCPKLKRLELHDTKRVLEHVPTLHSIREVVFTEHQHDHAQVGAEDGEEGEAVLSPRMMKVDADAADRRPTHSTLSTKAKRRSRVTRVVSD
jgi:hypothetical protein